MKSLVRYALVLTFAITSIIPVSFASAQSADTFSSCGDQHLNSLSSESEVIDFLRSLGYTRRGDVANYACRQVCSGQPSTGCFRTGVCGEQSQCCPPDTGVAVGQQCPSAAPATNAAANTSNAIPSGPYDPFAGQSVASAINGMIRFLMGLVGVGALIMFLWGGFLWMMAAGEEKDVVRAKTILRNGFFGLVFILFSYAILSAIINLAITYSAGRTL